MRQLENENRIKTVYNYDFSVQECKETTNMEENLVHLWKCINELEEVDRIIIGLYLENLNQTKIAEIVGLNHNNIRVRVHRIKEILSKKMKNHE